VGSATRNPAGIAAAVQQLLPAGTCDAQTATLI
jgi:hypothetical protein